MTSVRTTRRLTRILSVLPWIIEHEGASPSEIVDRFGYGDAGELVKDLHLVFMTGLPGYGPGDLIDVDIFDDEVTIDAADYFSRPLRLTPAEALGLLASGMALIESDQAPPALRSAVAKLARVIAPDDADIVQIDIPTPPHVDVLREAIRDGRVVRITYVGLASNTRTERTVEGRSVTFSLGNWYLSGYCRLAGADRIFRVDRITALDVLDESYVPPDTDDAYLGYTPNESDAQVTFIVDPDAAWVGEYYPSESVQLSDGRTRITMSVAEPHIAARLLLQLGPAVRDVQGAEVETALDELRRKILTRYARSV